MSKRKATKYQVDWLLLFVSPNDSPFSQWVIVIVRPTRLNQSAWLNAHPSVECRLLQSGNSWPDASSYSPTVVFDSLIIHNHPLPTTGQNRRNSSLKRKGSAATFNQIADLANYVDGGLGKSSSPTHTTNGGQTDPAYHLAQIDLCSLFWNC